MLKIPNFGRNPSIPITFTHKNTTYKGYFREVVGGAGFMWHLFIDGFFRGTMVWGEYNNAPGMPRDLKDAKYRLKFHSQAGDLDYLGEEFADHLMVWYQ